MTRSRTQRLHRRQNVYTLRTMLRTRAKTGLDLLREQVEAYPGSLRQLGRECGVHHVTLARLMNGGDIRLGNASKLFDTLDLELRVRKGGR